MQTSRGRDDAAAAATSDPLVLSGVAYSQGDASTPPAPSPNADIVAASPGSAAPPAVSASPLPATGAPPPAVVGAAPSPAPGTPAVTGAAPVQPAGLTPPAGGAQAPTPAAPVQPAETAEYPNINIPPKQPGGKLLTPEERDKLIQELNALAGRPSGAQ